MFIKQVRFLLFLFVYFSIFPMAAFLEKEIVVVIPSYNNKLWFDRNLGSVINQKYQNFRIIYVDDASEDGTAQLVTDYIKEHHFESKFTLIANTVRHGQLFNRYLAIHACPDDAIVFLLDGDDWLINDQVLAYINRVYTESNVLLTVGNACKSSNGQKIGHRDYTDQEIEQIGFRQLGFRGVHPRTFYAGLFKRISLEDLMHHGKFLMVATDVAFMLPMFEMARDQYAYINDLLYVYNDQNPINLYKSHFEHQIYYDLITRNRKHYEKLPENFTFERPQKKDAYTLSQVVFMQEEVAMQGFLKEQMNHGIEFDTCIKIGNGDPYRSKRYKDYFKLFQILDIGYPLNQIYHFRFNFKERLLKALDQCSSDYILIGTQAIFDDYAINLKDVIEKLEATQAFGILLGNADTEYLKQYSYNLTPYQGYQVYISNLWMFRQVFKEMSDCSGMLLRTSDCRALLKNLEIFHPNYFTLLAASNSLLPADSIVLIAQTEKKELPFNE